MDYVTMDVDGVKREFYVYVPESVKSGAFTNVPVVFAHHGGGGCGEEFAGRSGGDKLAEERHFIVVFPTGSRSNDSFNARTTWKISDMAFFEQARAYVIEHYSADSTRIYTTGQSMGCVMSLMIALTRPDLVAAAAATSALTDPNSLEGVDTETLIPLMLSVGEKDQYFVEGGMNYGQLPDAFAYWRGRYGITATEEDTYTYQNGNFHGYDFKNSQGITLLREQWVTGKIHAMLPDEIYTLYDFLSAFSRLEDGTLLYMGLPVK
jgi:poly(3-hydroxybutyrate) depolymerase